MSFNKQYHKSEKEKEVDKLKILHFGWYGVISYALSVQEVRLYLIDI